MKRWILVVVVVGMMTVGGKALGVTRQVDCAVPGQTISQTLETVMPGDIIEVSGTCAETVTITTDRITLDGGGSAIIEGAGGGAPVEVSEGLILWGRKGLLLPD